jgi:hypothetical protein
VTDHTLRTGA